MDTRRQLGLLAVVTSTACVFPTVTFAQDASANIQEVVVTGSRIRRADTFDSPVPVAIIDGDSLKSSGFTVLGDAMSTLPQAMISTNLQSTSGTLFNAGQSRVDLRRSGWASSK
jgi:iron complex outermembrane recepter protein